MLLTLISAALAILALLILLYAGCFLYGYSAARKHIAQQQRRPLLPPPGRQP